MGEQLLETGHLLGSWKTILVLGCVLVLFCPRMNNLVTYKYVIIQSDTMQYNFIAKSQG